METGNRSPYAHYVGLFGGKVGWLLICALFFTSYAIRIASDAWVTNWTTNAYAQSNGFYIGIYGVFVFGFLAWVFLRGFFFSLATTRTAEIMHENALNVRPLCPPPPPRYWVSV